jgi:hypothetical protein
MRLLLIPKLLAKSFEKEYTLAAKVVLFPRPGE